MKKKSAACVMMKAHKDEKQDKKLVKDMMKKAGLDKKKKK